jgi:aryl-alcohol dehydrogenase-like predicted oxidoreductase
MGEFDMSQQEINRREFVQKAVAGTVGAAGVVGAIGATQKAAAAQETDTSKILSYNENMEYRRQGKTNWMVSAVCLGGHSGSEEKERYEIVSRCIDAGINYIDACTGGEVRRDSKALKGRRDKMYLGFSNISREPRNKDCRTAKAMLAALDSLLQDASLEYADLWRITCLEPSGRHSFNTCCEIADAIETAKKQGKVRAGGFSAHDRRWIKFMIEYFPTIDCVCFPFTTMTKRAQTDSLFPALKKCDAGAFGIKPFAASSLFAGAETQEERDRRGRLAIRYILNSNTVIPIPGLNSLHEVDNVVEAIKERRELDLAEQAELEQAGKQMLASLPPKYEWLRDWQYA